MDDKVDAEIVISILKKDLTDILDYKAAVIRLIEADKTKTRS